MYRYFFPAIPILFAALLCSGCLPIPVSTVRFHAREARPILAESAQSENNGSFSSPVFDITGQRFAVYDSGSNQVQILRSPSLAPIQSLKPKQRPMRLRFSPGGNFLVIQSYQGWIENYLGAHPESSGIQIDSPEAVRDDIQRVEVWDLKTGKTIPDLRCDAEETRPPMGGWLWARKKVIARGYRSSAILTSRFSSDDGVFSILCHDGIQQQWNSQTWQRLEDIPPPPFWSELTRRVNGGYWAGNTAAGQSADGRIALLAVREKSLGFGTTHLWDRTQAHVSHLPGRCGTRGVPVYSLSADGKKLALLCNSGLGYELRAWDLDLQREIPLKGTNFSLTKGMPTFRSEGAAMSPDGRYVAAALLNQMEVLVAPGGVSRSDLRIWSLEQGREAAAVPMDDLVVDADYFRGVDLAFSPDSAILAVAGRRLRLYQTSLLVAPH